ATRNRRPGIAHPIGTRVAAGAYVAVVTGSGVVGVDASRSRIAAIVGADIAVVAVRRRATHAGAVAARILSRAGVAVVAGCTVKGRIGAGTRRGVAGSHRVTLVRGGAYDGVRASADAGLARVGLGAGVAVVAGRIVSLGRVRARSSCLATSANVMALIGSRT